MVASIVLFLFAPLPADFRPEVGDKFWLTSQTGYGDVWQAEVIKRDANPGQPDLWFRYPSHDGLTINDSTPVGRGHVYRTKVGAQVAVWMMAEKAAARSRLEADVLREKIGK